MNHLDYFNIDPTALLRMVADKAHFIALSTIFLEQAPTILSALQRAIECCDFEAIAMQSHALKGMTVIVGANEITTLLQRVESAARQGEIIIGANDALEANLAAVTREVARSMIEISVDL